MLKSDEIELDQSKRREKMDAINAKDTIDDTDQADLKKTAGDYEKAEVQKRSALLIEGHERSKIQVPDKAQYDFDRECRSFSLSNVIAAFEGQKPLTGREAEVSKEIETRHGPAPQGIRFPWGALETRADVSTTTVDALGGNLVQRTVQKTLERFFEGSVSQKFGVQTIQVEGKPSFPQIDTGAAASWVGEGSGADAAAIGTSTIPATIKTVMARYLLSRQSTKENSVLDAILRRDLSEILREAVDKAVFQGSGASNEPSGFAALLTGGRTSALTAKASFSALLAQAVMLMESAKLSDVGQVRIAGNPILFQTLADDLVTSTAVSALDRIKGAGFTPIFSQQVSGHLARDVTNKGASTVYFGAGESNAFLAAWGSPELIVDPYSESKSGKIALTMFSFLDVIIQRTATHFFKLTAVQDR